MFNLLRPFIFNLDPEIAHDLAIKALKFNYVPKDFFDVQDEKILEIDILDIKFKELIVDLDNDFLIDLSNINNIEKIIYRGIEFKLNKELNSYILNFNIRDLDTLL